MDNDGSAVTRLVAEAIAGEEWAWNELIDRYAPLVMAVMGRYRLTAVDCQDVSQLVWLRLVEHLAELREPRALPMWLVTTTRNECLRLLRLARRCEPFDPSRPNPADRCDDMDLAEEALREERRQALHQAMAELPLRYRNLLLLLIEEPPVPYAEISVRLGIPIGSIGPTRARAIQRLRASSPLVGLFDTGEPGGGGRWTA